MRRTHSRRFERGAAAVEFAFVLPLLVVIVCATIDWGYYFFTREIVVNASREGARVGTLQFPDGTNVRDEVVTAASTYLRVASLDDARANIETDVGPPSGGACPGTASCVQITYTLGGGITGFSGFPGLGYAVPSTIVAYAQMRK